MGFSLILTLDLVSQFHLVKRSTIVKSLLMELNTFDVSVALDCRQSVSLFLREIRMPEIENEHDPLVTLVPDFVVERVVEDKHLALVPGHKLVGNTQTRPGLGWSFGPRNAETQVSPEPAIGWSGVSKGMSPTVH